MVCRALWDDAHHTITDWNLQALSTTPKDPVALVESWSGRDTSFCFVERFVGPDLQQEIRDAWWCKSLFRFKTSQLIHKFINKNFWGTTITGQIRSVVVDLLYREASQRPGQFQPPRLVPTVAKTDLGSELERVYALSLTSKIAFAIKKRPYRRLSPSVQMRQEAFLSAASGLFPGLARLRRDGFSVSVIVDGDIEIKLDQVDISTEGWRRQLRQNEEVCSSCELCMIVIAYPVRRPLAMFIMLLRRVSFTADAGHSLQKLTIRSQRSQSAEHVW